MQIQSSLTRRGVLLLLASSLMGLTIGCGESPPDMDTSLVDDPLGKPGVCQFCKKPIEKVSEENYLIVRGNRHIVCDEKCAEGQREWLSKQ